MKKLFILLALAMFGTLSAQNSPVDLLPSGTEYYEEPWPWGGKILYVYDALILEHIEGLEFTEIRETESCYITCYETGDFVVRWVQPNENALYPKEFLQIYKK